MRSLAPFRHARHSRVVNVIGDQVVKYDELLGVLVGSDAPAYVAESHLKDECVTVRVRSANQSAVLHPFAARLAARAPGSGADIGVEERGSTSSKSGGDDVGAECSTKLALLLTQGGVAGAVV